MRIATPQLKLTGIYAGQARALLYLLALAEAGSTLQHKHHQHAALMSMHGDAGTDRCPKVQRAKDFAAGVA